MISSPYGKTKRRTQTRQLRAQNCLQSPTPIAYLHLALPTSSCTCPAPPTHTHQHSIHVQQSPHHPSVTADGPFLPSHPCLRTLPPHCLPHTWGAHPCCHYITSLRRAPLLPPRGMRRHLCARNSEVIVTGDHKECCLQECLLSASGEVCNTYAPLLPAPCNAPAAQLPERLHPALQHARLLQHPGCMRGLCCGSGSSTARCLCRMPRSGSRTGCRLMPCACRRCCRSPSCMHRLCCGLPRCLCRMPCCSSCPRCRLLPCACRHRCRSPSCVR